VLAVNRTDLVDHKQAIFDMIMTDYTVFADKDTVEKFTAMPASCFMGDNFTAALSDNIDRDRGQSPGVSHSGIPP